MCQLQLAAMKADLSFEDDQLEHEFRKLQAGRSRQLGKQVGADRYKTGLVWLAGSLGNLLCSLQPAHCGATQTCLLSTPVGGAAKASVQAVCVPGCG